MYVCVYVFVYVDTYIHTHDTHTHTHMHTQVLLATPLPQPGPHAPAAGMAGEPEEGGREWEGSTAGGEGTEVSHMVQHHGGAEVSHGGGDGPLSRMWRERDWPAGAAVWQNPLRYSETEVSHGR